MRSLLLALPAALVAALAVASAAASGITSNEFDDTPEPSIASHARGDSIPLCIVTTRELRPEFLRLAHAHTRDGLRAGVWTLESIRRGYPVAHDDAERIRMFLQDVHRERGARWLLLGGDATQIPVRQATLHLTIFGPPPADRYLVPTDQYYACLDGTWNADGDDDWGESATDDVDTSPDLIVGRATVGTPWEARRFVERTIAALEPERCAPDGSVLLAAEVFGPSIDAAIFAEQLRPTFEALPGTHVARLYENATAWPGAATETRLALIDSLNRGYDVAVLYGGADATRINAGVDSPPTELFTVHDAEALTTHRATTVYFATGVTCSLGTTPCLGEAMIKARDANIVAVVGMTCIGFLGQISNLSRLYFQACYLQGATTVGEALTRAIVAIGGQIGTSDTGRLVTNGAILLGDPALPVRPIPPPAALARVPVDESLMSLESDHTTLGLVTSPHPVTSVGTAAAKSGVSLVRRGSTDIPRFELAIPASLAGVALEIAAFDAAGRRVRTIDLERATAGSRTFEWDLKDDAGARVATGVYFLSVRAGEQMVSRRVTIVR